MDFLSSPSTVDWCEDNYVYISWIAELWNVLSSFVLIYAGYYGFIYHQNLKGNIVFFTLGIVGAGSVLFHGSLTAFTQMLDEIPMVFLVLQLTQNILNIQSPYIRTFSYVIATFFSGLIYYTAFLDETISQSTNGLHGGMKHIEFYIFQGSIIAIGAFIFLQLLSKSLKSPLTRLLFIRGCGLFLLGWCCWLTDYFLCPLLQKYGNVQLHAWWHILSAFGVYHLALLSIFLANPHENLILKNQIVLVSEKIE